MNAERVALVSGIAMLLLWTGIAIRVWREPQDS